MEIKLILDRLTYEEVCELYKEVYNAKASKELLIVGHKREEPLNEAEENLLKDGYIFSATENYRKRTGYTRYMTKLCIKRFRKKNKY